MLLKKYEDFVDRVNELGYMTFSSILPGFPSLPEETSNGSWHTGDMDTDPWRWKDRAAEEKRLAFGCILGGNKGFVSARMYSLFYTAFHPQEHMEERRAYGQISQPVWQLWQLFAGCIGEHRAVTANSPVYMDKQEALTAAGSKTLLDTGDIRQKLGVTKKGGSKVDRAIQDLQQYYYITVAGNRQKVDKLGQPYGWPSNVYEIVENWVPKEWMQQNKGLSPQEAREIILDRGVAISKGINRPELKKMLGMKRD